VSNSEREIGVGMGRESEHAKARGVSRTGDARAKVNRRRAGHTRSLLVARCS
jgi:uncharacterized protein (DUF1499 family)